MINIIMYDIRASRVASEPDSLTENPLYFVTISSNQSR